MYMFYIFTSLNFSRLLWVVCILCSSCIIKATDRYVVGGRGKVDLVLPLESLKLPYVVGKSYLCKSCQWNRNREYGRIIENQRKSQGEIIDLFNNRNTNSLKRRATDESEREWIDNAKVLRTSDGTDLLQVRNSSTIPQFLKTSTPLKVSVRTRDDQPFCKLNIIQ